MVLVARPLVSDGVALGIVSAVGQTVGLALCLAASSLFTPRTSESISGARTT